MKKVEYQQGSKEWLDWKRGKISASMVATIMGMNPYETPLQLYHRMQNDQQIKDNEHMARGRRLEPEARKMANDLYAAKYEPACFESEIPWLICSLDGWDADNEFPVLEIKCPNKDRGEEVSDLYIPQLQCQMWVTKSKKVRYMRYIDGVTHINVVAYDQEFVDKMLEAVKLFYKGYIEFIEPDPILGRDIPEIYSPEAHNAAEEYMMACNLYQLAEERKEKARKALIELNGNESFHVPGYNLTIRKIHQKGNVDYKKIPELKGVNLDLYRKDPIVKWTIR